MTFADYRRYVDEQKEPKKRKNSRMLRHTLIHPYTDDENHPDTDSFYRRLLDLMLELTGIANDKHQGLEIEYNEDPKSMVLSTFINNSKAFYLRMQKKSLLK